MFPKQLRFLPTDHSEVKSFWLEFQLLILSHMTCSGFAFCNFNGNLISAFSSAPVLEKNPPSASGTFASWKIVNSFSTQTSLRTNKCSVDLLPLSLHLSFFLIRIPVMLDLGSTVLQHDHTLINYFCNDCFKIKSHFEVTG